MTRIKVLVVEDDPLIAEDIREFLTNADYEVAAVVHHKEAAYRALKNAVPDIALLDINLNHTMDGLTIAGHINVHYQIPFIYLTSYSGKSVVTEAKQTRPMGYIVKPFDESDLYAAIEVALFNHSQRNQIHHFSRNTLNKQIENDLTAKEFEILMDLYEGRTNKQMSEKHFVSINTIKTHIQNIYLKMNTNSRTTTIARLRQLVQ